MNKFIAVVKGLKAVAVCPVRINSYSRLDLSEANQSLLEETFTYTERFTKYLDGLRSNNGVEFLVGGYNELRKVYGRSELFGANAGEGNQEPRRLHIGLDIWGDAGTAVVAPLDGTVHSFANNDQYGDYGATIILQHSVRELTFHTLYGHLAKQDLKYLEPGRKIERGEQFAQFGVPSENGHWPPHLHFQVIRDMENKFGDYPGVCRFSEASFYLSNCPDPELLIRL